MELKNFLKRRDLGHAGALAGAHVVMALCGLAANVIWARWVPQEVFGGFKVIFSLANLVGTLCLLGAGQAALMSAAQNSDGNLVRLIRAKLLANTAGSVLLLAAAGYYAFAAEASVPIAYGLVTTALLFPAYNISDIWTSWLNGQARFRELATGRALIYVLPLLGVATVAIFGISDLWHVAALYFTLTSIQNVVMLRKIVALRSNVTVDEGILLHGRHTTVAMMFGSLVALDVIILNHYFSATEVAVLAIALVFPDQVKSLFSIFNQLFAPRMYADRPLAVFWQEFRLTFFALTLAFVAIGVLGFFLLPLLVPLLFSAKYGAAAEYAKWLWLAVATLGSTTYLGVALMARKRLVFVYGAFVGHPALLATLYFYNADDGVRGMVTARIIATIGLAMFYVGGFMLALRRENGRNC